MKKIIIILISLLFILTFFISPVEGATGDIPLEYFDTYGAGVNTGTNAYVTWLGEITAQTSATQKQSGSLSLRCAVTGTSDVSINLHTPSNFYNFSFWVYLYNGNNNQNDWYISLHNQTTDIIKFRAYESNDAIYVYDYGADAYVAVWSGSSPGSKWLQIGVQANHTAGQPINYMYCYIKNATGVLKFQTEFAWNSSYDFNDVNPYLSQIWINQTGALGAFYTYFDTFLINTETLSGGGYGEFGELTPICSGGLGIYGAIGYTEVIGGITIPWYPNPITIGGISITTPIRYIEHEFPYQFSGTIYGVDLPVSIEQLSYVSNDTNDYWLTINGIPSFGHPDYILPTVAGEYVLRWVSDTGVTLSHEKPLFAFYCDEYEITTGSNWYWYSIGMTYDSIGDSLGHNNNGLYTDIYFNGYNIDGGDISMCYYVITDETEQGETGLTADELINYTGLYGYQFIEFYQNTVNCFHGIGSNPYIMYYVNDTYLEPTSPFYRYQIMKVGENLAVYAGLISMTGTHKDAKMRILDYSFTNIGQYYIVLYNTTDYGTVLGTELYYSQVITVCEKGIGDPVEDEETPGLYGFDFSDIPVFFKIIISLLIIIIVTITPYALISLINRGRVQVEIPGLLYVAFFFIGIIISIMLGFLDAWVFFIVLFGLIITFAIMWIRGQNTGGE
jgi:hypothetical protein